MNLIVKFSQFAKRQFNQFLTFLGLNDLGMASKNRHRTQWLTTPFQPRSGYAEPSSGSRKIKNSEPNYTSQEVIKYLREQGGGERAKWVIREASSFYIYDPDHVPPRFRGRERLYEKLPFVLYKYSQGWSSAEIAKTISYFST